MNSARSQEADEGEKTSSEACFEDSLSLDPCTQQKCSKNVAQLLTHPFNPINKKYNLSFKHVEAKFSVNCHFLTIKNVFELKTGFRDNGKKTKSPRSLFASERS